MNKEQALRIIIEATAMLRLTRKEHEVLMAALNFLKMDRPMKPVEEEKEKVVPS